jgi:hypothetical protein
LPSLRLKLPVRYQKVSLIAYLGTYFAMAGSFPLVVMEAVLTYTNPAYYTLFSEHGFDITLTCTIIFGAISTLGEIIMRWRSESLKGGRQVWLRSPVIQP